MAEFRKDHHCVYLCDYHLILPTKYRRKIINPGLWPYLKRKLLEISEHYPRIYFKSLNHDQEHLHLFISIPPQTSVGSTVRLIKTNTARGA